MENLEKKVKEAKASLYNLAGALPEDHFVFTSSAEEAINHVILASYLDITRKTGKNHFITSENSHSSIKMAIKRLTELGCIFDILPQVSLEAISEAISPRTALISLSWADGITGLINQDLPLIAKLCKERAIAFHIDATEVFGKGPFYWHDTGADFLTFNGKVEGTGALFIREGVDLSPLILAENMQGGLRGGSFSKKLLIEMGENALNDFENNESVNLQLAWQKKEFEDQILAAIKDAQIIHYQEDRLPHLSAIAFAGIYYEALQYLLLKKDISSEKGPAFNSLSFDHSKASFDPKIIAQTVQHLRKYAQDL